VFVVRPVKTHEVEDPVSEVEHAAGVATDGLEVTVNPVSGAPPVLPGAVHDTVAEVSEVVATALTPVGAPGAVAGVAAADAVEAAPVPTPLVAVTVNVYGVPLVRPVTVQPVVAVVQVKPPGDEVAVYPVMVDPPLEAGAVQLTADAVLT